MAVDYNTLTNREKILKAIQYHYLCYLNYNDEQTNAPTGLRKTVIYAYGLSQAGNPVFRAYQEFGASRSKREPRWRLFRLDRIISLTVLTKRVRQNNPHPLFNPNGDGKMRRVYAIAKFSKIIIKNMSNLINRLKLAKLLMKFNQIETNAGVFVFEGDLEIGREVFVEVDGELKPVEDGEYIYFDQVIVVKDGKVESITKVEPEEKVEIENAEEEVVEDEKDLAIKELTDEVNALQSELEAKEAEIQNKDAEIARLQEELAKKEEAFNEAQKPAHLAVNDSVTDKSNAPKSGALKYFK